MSATCQVCGAKSDVWLCNKHIDELKKLLTDLPQWLLWLEESAIGQVKFGGGGRGSSRGEPFSGEDEPLGKCVCKHGEKQHSLYYVAGEGDEKSVEQACAAVDDVTHTQTVLEIDEDGEESTTEVQYVVAVPCRCRQYEPRNTQAKVRAQLLSTGRVNARASERLDAVRNTLTTTKRHLQESRGIVYVRAGFIGPLLAGHVRTPRNPEPTAAVIEYLIENVHSIACDETAKETFAEIEGHQKAIERIVNRPVRQVWVGQCPTWQEQARQNCGVSLWAPEDAVEIRCRRCRQTHNCDRLKLMLYSDLEREKVPWSKILQANKSQPEDRQIPERTLQSWRKPGKKGEPPKLRARLYRRRDGRTVINRHSEDDEPLYLWSDVRKLRDAKPQKKVTGAAARQRVAN